MLGDGQAVTRGQTVCLLNLGQEGSGSFCKHTRSRPSYRNLLSHVCCSHMPSRLDNTQPLKHQTLTSCCGLYIISDITHSSGTDWRHWLKTCASSFIQLQQVPWRVGRHHTNPPCFWFWWLQRSWGSFWPGHGVETLASSRCWSETVSEQRVWGVRSVHRQLNESEKVKALD